MTEFETPVVCRYGWGAYFSSGLASLAFICLGLFLAFASYKIGIDQSQFTLWFGLGFTIVFGAGPWIALKGSLTLHQDRLVFQSFFQRLTICRDEIEQTSNVEKSMNTVSIYIKVKNNRWQKRVHNFGQNEKHFLEWFAEFPNLERDASSLRSEQILSNPAFGSNPKEREFNFNSEAGRVNLIKWPIIAAVSWGLFYPHPYDICLTVLLTIPCLAFFLVATSRGRWTLLDGEDGARIAIGGLMGFLPIMILGLRTFLDIANVDWYSSAAYAAGLGIILFIGVVALEKKLSIYISILSISLTIVYAWSLISFVNIKYDNGDAQIYPVSVLARDDDNKLPSLTVTRWGHKTSKNSLKADLDFVRSVKIGERVCVVVFEGALKVPWYDVRQCPAQLTKQPE